MRWPLPSTYCGCTPTAGAKRAALLAARASEQWRGAVANEMTIQVRPDPRRNIEQDIARAVELDVVLLHEAPDASVRLARQEPPLRRLG